MSDRNRAIGDSWLSAHAKALLESTGEGIFSLDRQGRCIFANASAGQMLGYDPEEILGTNLHALIHYARPDGSPYPEEACPIYQAFRTGESCRVTEEVFWRKDGSCFPVEYASHPIIEEGLITGAVVTFLDITQRKRAEEQILFQAHLLEQVQAAVIATDLQGMVIHWNEHAERLYGWSREETLGCNVSELTVGPKEAEVANEIMEQLRAGTPWEGEFEVQRKDGSTFFAYVTDSLI